jgi:hypothetical protein
MKKKPESGAYLVMKNKPKESKIDDLRARSTCEQNQSVCVILHISSWRYGRIVTFWCINDDCNLCVCVWFCISRDMLVWLSLCSTIFCMIYLLTCKHEEEQTDGGWLICVSFDVISVCVCVCVWFCISRDMLVWLSLWSTIFVWFTYSLASMKKNKPTGAG